MLRRFRHIVPLFLLSLWVGQAQAADFQPPKGCAAYLTVQLKQCEVKHFWRCEGAPEGDIWFAKIDARGPVYAQHVDKNFRWLESVPLRPGGFVEKLGHETDPTDFNELQSTGNDTYDFTIDTFDRGRKIRTERFVGFDQLSGGEVLIDGERLQLTKFSFEVFDGDERTARISGQQFLSPRYRLFFSGREKIEARGQSFEVDEGPLQFIEPGEPGFLSAEPLFGCGMTMSGLELPLSANKEFRDEL